MIIDSHCHVYPEKIAEKAVESIGKFYSIAMDYDGRIETLVSESEKNGITHSVIFSVATKPAQVRSINHFIADTVKSRPDRFIGLGTLHPDSEDIESEVDEIIALGLRGVKLHPDIQAIALDDERCERIYSAIEGKIPLLVHAGDERYKYSNPENIKKVLTAHPRLTVIAAHLGGYSIWEQAAKELAPYENLFVDCSSSLAMLTAQKAEELIRTYGTERVLFATDFPMWKIDEEMARFNALNLTREEKESIFYKNAIRVFGLKKI